MRWPAVGIAGFARQAGWRGGDLVDAVALALATSQGDDHARYVVEPGPSEDARGLWGLDVVALPDLLTSDLYDPRVNARVTYGLWRAAGGSFGWSPVYRVGEWRWRRDDALTALSGAGGAVAVPVVESPSPVAEGARRAVSALREVAEGAASLVRAGRFPTH